MTGHSLGSHGLEQAQLSFHLARDTVRYTEDWWMNFTSFHFHIRLIQWRKLFPSERISSCEDRRLTYIIVFQKGMWFISTSNFFVHTLSPYDNALSLWIEMRITSLSIVGFSMPIPLTNRTKQSDHPCPSPSSVNCWKSIAQEWTISIRRFQGKREGEPDHRDLLMKSIREDG